MKRKSLIDVLYLSILSIITLYIWHPLSKLILQGESYTYLISEYYLPLFTSTWKSFANFDVQSMLTGSILSKLFGLNIPMYFWIEILSILTINVSVFFLVKTLTGKSQTGFIAACIFATYFFGIGFFHPNWYATFLQRLILNMPLLLISFLFLHRFLEEKKSKYYEVSLVLFFLSIFLAHFGILLSFPILVYPVFWKLGNSFHFRSFISGLRVSAPYIAIVFFFLYIQQLWGENLAPKESFFYFLTHPRTYRYAEGILVQLASMSQYPSVVQAILAKRPPLAFSGPSSAYKFVLPVVTVYIAGSVILWTKAKKYRALLLTIVFSLIISLLINMYLGRSDFFRSAGENRYFYYPSLYLAIFWSLLLTVLLRRKKPVLWGVLFGFLLINFAIFQKFFSDVTQNYARPTKILYQYIVNNADQLPSNSLVVGGPIGVYFGTYEAAFLTEQLGNKRGIKFMTQDYFNNHQDVALNFLSITQLQYDKKCNCVKKALLK